MKKICIVIMILSVILSAKAQESESISFSLGADIVSSYVWRGMYQTGASVQPAAGLEVAGFSISAWGNMDIASTGFKEVDFTIGYSIAGLDISITDYWWEGEDTYKYFMYESHRTDHLFEASLAYTLPLESFPLSLSWSTMFAGADYTKEDGDRGYSTYVELAYPFEIKDVSLGVSLGLTPWEGLYAPDFSVTSVALGAAKILKITDSFSLPVFGQIIANPRSEGIYFVFGISL